MTAPAPWEHPDILDQIKALLASVRDLQTVRHLLTDPPKPEMLRLDDDAVEPALAEANRQLMLDATFDRQREIGTHRHRLELLYKRTAREKPQVALAAERELIALLDLRPQHEADDDPAGSPTQRPHLDEVAAELYAALDELEGLLASPPPPEASYVEVVQAAAAELTATPRKTKSKKQAKKPTKTSRGARPQKKTTKKQKTS